MGGGGGVKQIRKTESDRMHSETDPMMKGRDGVRCEGGLVIRSMVDEGTKM